MNNDQQSDTMTPTTAAAAAAALSTMVTPGYETSTLVDTIYDLSSIAEIGSNKFMVAYCINLERLSVQAHLTAGRVVEGLVDVVNVGRGSGGGKNDSMASPGLDNVLSSLTTGLGGGGDYAGGIGGMHGNNNEEQEYIVQAFLENEEKIIVLVKTLLSLELWRDNVLFGRSDMKKKNNADDGGEGIGEEEEVEFEIEGGERNEEEEEYDELNDVDGGEGGGDDGGNNTSSRGLAQRLATNGNALRTAFILHVETTIVSLLNLIFYRGVPPALLEGGSGGSGSGDDVLLSLVDYCARQLIFLGTPEESNPAISRQKNPLPASQLSSYLEHRSRIEEIQDSVYDSTYQTAIASVALSRYICDNVSELGPSMLSRVLEVHDFPLLLVPLVEEPPWTRRRLIEKRGNYSNGSKVSTTMIWEKLDDHNEWREVPASDLLHLTKLEGQPWLALYHLTTASVCRESYGLDEYRKLQLMRLRKYIHETLMDQLPILGDVARYLDELSILGVPPAGQGVHRPSSNASSSGLLLQRVDSVRESIVGKRNVSSDAYWEGVAQKQWDDIFSHVTDSSDEELRRIASEVYGEAGIDDALAIAASTAVDSSPLDGLVGHEMEEPQSTTADDWKPIQKIVLELKDEHNNSLASFDLVPMQNGAPGAATITDTPFGTFRRNKMTISQMNGDGAIHPRAKVEARIQFESDPESLLSTDSLALPTVEHTASQNRYDEVGIELPLDSFPSSKEWRQLGDLERKSIVIQIQFERLERGIVPAGSSLLRGYALSRAFVSQPLAG